MVTQHWEHIKCLWTAYFKMVKMVSFMLCEFYSKNLNKGGTWVAQSVKRWTLAQVMILWFMDWSPTSGSMPGACFQFCVSLSLPLPHSCSVSLCLSKMNKHFKKFKNKLATISGCLHGSVGWASDFCLGHDLRFVSSSPTSSGSLLYVQSPLWILCLPLSLLLPNSLALSQK